jgi:methionine salvage enolase-phosphatase E1
LNLIKPDAAIYEDMIEGLEIAPEEGLFFDDRPENVEGARAVGLRAELFDSWEKLIEGTPARYGLPVPGATAGQTS